MDKELILQQALMLKALGYDEIVTLAHLSELRAHAAGETVIAEGEPASHVYVIGSGAAEVRRGEHVLGRVGPGDSVGEMALIDDSPRSAAVVMVEDGSVVALHRDVFRDLVRGHPEMYEDLYRLLAQRLRGTGPG